MGGAVSSIFGGGGYEAPDPVKYDPAPVRETAQEPESSAVRNEERRKLKARRSMSGTLLTSPLGSTDANGPSSSGNGLLGRV